MRTIKIQNKCSLLPITFTEISNISYYKYCKIQRAMKPFYTANYNTIYRYFSIRENAVICKNKYPN